MERLAAVFLLFCVLLHAAAGAQLARSAGLGLPFSEPRGTVCKAIRVCHNSRGLTYTTVEVTAALEPLFEGLGLSVTKHVQVLALEGCLAADSCCCSTPVEVRLSLPAERDGVLASAKAAIQTRIADGMPGVMCVQQELIECAPQTSTDRRRLLQTSDLQDSLVLPVAVPAMTAAWAGFARILLDEDAAGGYGYGGYGGEGGYGEPEPQRSSRRRLLAEDGQEAQRGEPAGVTHTRLAGAPALSYEPATDKEQAAVVTLLRDALQDRQQTTAASLPAALLVVAAGLASVGLALMARGWAQAGEAAPAAVPLLG